MKKNVGNFDRGFRFLAAILITILYFTNVLTGTLAIVLLVAAIIFAVTSMISFCPIYGVFGISSRKNKAKAVK